MFLETPRVGENFIQHILIKKYFRSLVNISFINVMNKYNKTMVPLTRKKLFCILNCLRTIKIIIMNKKSIYFKINKFYIK